MGRRRRKRKGELVVTDLEFNGNSDVSKIYKEIKKTFAEVGTAYKTTGTTKTPRGVLDIRYALKHANKLIYDAAQIRAPIIKPHIYQGQSKANQAVSLKNHMVEGQRLGKKWINRGIIARRVVTFRGKAKVEGAMSPAQYAASVEFGREKFMQVAKKPVGITGGETDYYLRTVGATQPDPFLIPALEAKAQPAYDLFYKVLEKRWNTTMKTTAKRNGSNNW